MIEKFSCILLLGFVALASAQNTTPCGCDELRGCLNSKKQEFQAQHQTCHSGCISSSNLQNPTAVNKCFTDKQSQMESQMQAKGDCFFNPANGACAASRGRREAWGQFNRTGGRFGEGFQGGRGGEGFQAGRGFQMGPAELKPYHDCMRSCFMQNRPQPAGGSQQGQGQGQQGRGQGFGGFHQDGGRGKHGGGFMMPGLKECTDNLNCNVSRDGARQAFEACKSNDQSGRDQMKQIEQNFCVCLRGALGKTETDMPCQAPTEGEGRGGFRRGGRWGGNRNGNGNGDGNGGN